MLNGAMMQYFHWYSPKDGTHWNHLASQAEDLAKAGFTALWLPPAYKGSHGSDDVGYGAYDLFDLGEFEQQGSVRTKYGTQAEYLNAIKTAQESGLQVYADCVFNHKYGGDHEEAVEAVPVAAGDRNQSIGDDQTLKARTHFSFPGRNGQYSSLEWHWWHFDSIHHNPPQTSSPQTDETQIYRLKNKQFETEVDLQSGSYDFTQNSELDICAIDTQVEEVTGELNYWGEWIFDTTQVDGFRLNAVQHLRTEFFNQWLDHVRTYAHRDLFTVGEYWSEDLDALHWFLGRAGGRISLFDVPLHYNFHRASQQGRGYDLRKIFDGTLVQEQPALSVTFVENHASQPLQALESLVEPWFKPLAYALILLRRDGYPCVFQPDYEGAHYCDRGHDGEEHEIWLDSHRWLIDKFLYARQHHGYGEQYDYFNHREHIGWTRLGNATHPEPMAVLLSNGPAAKQWMEVGRPHTQFYDLTEHSQTPVITNEWGWGEFTCPGGSISVWLPQAT